MPKTNSGSNGAQGKKTTQIVVGITNKDNWDRLVTWALATPDVQANMPTGDADTIARSAVNRAVKTMLFSSMPTAIGGLDRTLEKERTGKGTTKPVSALAKLVPEGIKLTAADMRKAQELALQQALSDPAVMAAMQAAMANVAANVAAAERLQDAAKLEASLPKE